MESQTPEQKIADIAIELARLRIRKAELRSKRRALACEYESPGDSDVGYEGRGPCWYRGDGQVCPTCEKRIDVHAEFGNVSSKATGAMRRLVNAVRRLEINENPQQDS